MIRVATAPMNWNSDDLPDLRPEIPIGQVLAEIVEAGYEGTEYGTGLPADPKALRAILADGIHTLARACEPLGVRLAVHPHAGFYVETRAEVETLFNVTDAKALGLCVDAGHLVYGGADPVEVVETYGPRVRYVHIKDVNPRILALSTQNGLGFLGALRSYIFCDLGRGCVDLGRFMGALHKVNYSGWMVIEQDTSPKSPLETARANRRYLKETFGL